jgi:hypothetical protein
LINLHPPNQQELGELDLGLRGDEEAFSLAERSYDRSFESCFEILIVGAVDLAEGEAVASLAPIVLAKIHVSMRMMVY